MKISFLLGFEGYYLVISAHQRTSAYGSDHPQRAGLGRREQKLMLFELHRGGLKAPT
jgi:hypothetical protein